MLERIGNMLDILACGTPKERAEVVTDLQKGNRLALMEALRFGTTSVSDMYDHVDAIAAAVTNQKVQRFLIDHANITSVVEKE